MLESRSNISYLIPYFRAAGILDSLDFVKIDGDYHVNGRYISYSNLNGYFHGLAELFPDQKESVLSFITKRLFPEIKNNDVFGF